MGGVRFACRKTYQPYDYAHSLFVGRPLCGTGRGPVQTTYLKLWEGGCRHLRDFAIQYPDAILGYLKKTAANVTHDYFKHGRSQSSGGMDKPHISTSDCDPEAGKQTDGSQEMIDFGVFLKEIDDYLKRSLSGPDQERDRMIFWLYFRQGMSTKEIASLPTIGLGMKGVGSVIERLKHGMREKILGSHSNSEDEAEGAKSKIPRETRNGFVWRFRMMARPSRN